MPQVTQEDEMQMLYQAFKLTGQRPRMEDLAVVMGLKAATAQWRWTKLMKRMAEQYDGQAPATPAKKAAKPKANGTKRKKEVKDEDDGPEAKRVELEDDVKPEINGDGEAVEDEGGDSTEV